MSYRKALFERRKRRVIDLLDQGLTTRQIAARLGISSRAVLHIKTRCGRRRDEDIQRGSNSVASKDDSP